MSLSNKERFEIFAQRASELRELRLIRQGIDPSFTIKWETVSQRMTYHTTPPDEESLRSFLLTFRQFVSKGEPIFVSRIFNDAIRFMSSGELREELVKAKDAWQQSFNKTGEVAVVIDQQNITGEYILDLWINGYYFHNDPDKRQELHRLFPDAAPLIRIKFLIVLYDLTNIILYLGNVIRYGLSQEMFPGADSDH